MNLMELVAIYLVLVYLAPFYWISFLHCSARLLAVWMYQRASFASICSKETEKWQVKNLQMKVYFIFNHGARNWMQITLQMVAFKPNPNKNNEYKDEKNVHRLNSEWNRFLFLPYDLPLSLSLYRFRVCVFYVPTKINERALFVTRCGGLCLHVWVSLSSPANHLYKCARDFFELHR